MRKSKIILLSLILLALIAAAGYGVYAYKAHKKHANNAVATPVSIKKNSHDQLGKELTLRGVLVRGTNGTYYLMSTEKTGATGVMLDFKQNKIDPAKYFSGSTQASAPKTAPGTPPVNESVTEAEAAVKASAGYSSPTVIVSGKFVQSSPKAAPVLQVQKISKT